MQSTKTLCGSKLESSEGKSILGIVGSPRKGGNTDTLVDTVLAGAAECGAVSEKIILQELSIAPCRACNYCKKHGKCIQDDRGSTKSGREVSISGSWPWSSFTA